MELLKVDSLEEATNKLYNEYVNNQGNIGIEEVNVSNSFDRVLAEDVFASINVPEFDRSTVDGYAVIASDTGGASESIPTFLKVVGESKMGEACDIEIKSGECVYVPTGGMLPRGANACVMVEHIENITDSKIAVYDSVADGKSVIRLGDDIKKGEIALKKGKRITAADMGYLSSIAVNTIKVYKKWNITIISTGDELVDEKSEYKLGKIRDVNTNLLLGLSQKYGLNIINKYLLKDDENILKETLKNAMIDSDVVVMSGGSSKGKKDASSSVIDKTVSSGVLTHGIAIKPGKPTITGFDKNTNTLVVGLPGHPVASAILFKLIVIGMYNRIRGNTEELLSCEGIMTENIPASPGRQTFQLVSIDDKFNISPVYGRSGLIHTLSVASGYIVLEKDQEGINKGDKVKVYYL